MTDSMRDEHERQKLAELLWRREGGACVSMLVSTLASGMGREVAFRGDDGRNLAELCEQAFELASPVPDYEEAATQDKWTGPHKDKFGATYFEIINPLNDGQRVTWACATWEELCREFAIDADSYQREVFEHWIVSDWLADKLMAKGEKCDKDFAGLTVWARTTTGQGIACDGVMQAIACELWRTAEDRTRALA